MDERSFRGPFFDHSPLLQAVLTPAGEFIEWNNVWEQRGISPEGNSLQQFLANKHIVAEAWQTLLSGEQIQVTTRLQGDFAPFDVAWTLIRPAGTAEFLCVIGQPKTPSAHDPSQAERIRYEAARTVLGAFTHKFNNLLTPIVTLSEVILRQIPQTHAWHDHIKLIHRSGIRSGAFLRQVHSFYPDPGDIAQPSEVDLQDLLRETLKSWCEEKSALSPNWSNQLEITTELAEVPALQGSPKELQQAFTEILQNAGEAFLPERSETGTLSVRLHHAESDLVITIEDNGCGMTPEAREHCFDPFYTTKSEAEGIGLCVALGAVRRHRGNITVRSQESRGTTVIVHLPTS